MKTLKFQLEDIRYLGHGAFESDGGTTFECEHVFEGILLARILEAYGYKILANSDLVRNAELIQMNFHTNLPWETYDALKRSEIFGKSLGTYEAKIND